MLGPGQIDPVRLRGGPQKLFALAKAITNDYDRFAAVVRSNPNQRVGESTP